MPAIVCLAGARSGFPVASACVAAWQAGEATRGGVFACALVAGLRALGRRHLSRAGWRTRRYSQLDASKLRGVRARMSDPEAAVAPWWTVVTQGADPRSMRAERPSRLYALREEV